MARQAVGPQPEPLPPLPAPGGPARAVLLPISPKLLFLYWVLDDGVRQRLDQATGPAELRLEWMGEAYAPGQEHEARRGDGGDAKRLSFDFRSGSWYLDVAGTTGRVRARLGLIERGRFVEILASNELLIPRAEPGPGPEIWMDRRALRAGHGEPLPPPTTRRLEPGGAGKGSSPAEVVRDGVSVRPSPVSSPGGRLAWSTVPRHDVVAGEPAGRVAAATPLWSEPEAPADIRAGRRPPGKAPVPPIGVANPVGYLGLVLHAHLPFVRHPEHDFFLEEQWLFEGITETYLPILDALDQLARERAPVRLTMSLSPTLLAMLSDPLLMAKYERLLGRLCHLAWREVERTRKDPDFSPVAGFYWDRLHRYQHLFVERWNRDLPAVFRDLEDRGVLELMTCAATHGFLPLHRLDPGTLRGQIETAVAEHRRLLGRTPRGLWLPECAYFEGLDAYVADAGIEYFFVDTHAIRNATSPPRFDVHAPLLCPTGVAAFGRDEESSVQVWSSQEGYPGDPSYRDFYRDIGFDLEHAYVAPYLDPAGTRGMTGFKYHRITGRTDWKEPYKRAAALRSAARHAADFVGNRRAQMTWLRGGLDRPPLVVSMYDAELFGHWWFEGPDWLDLVLRGLPGAGIAAVSPAQYLEAHPVTQVARPSESSWGENGYHDVWLRSDNDWIVPPLHDASRRMAAIADEVRSSGTDLRRRLAAQAARELLLAQASDWPFILKNRTTPEYARQRVHEHLDRFDRLARLFASRAGEGSGEARRAVDVLAAIESRDNLFPEIDPGLWGTR
ncbi:MAG TPA: 1,4-alpha-glucan branching protein domain-containing protein [Verrucomicrobiae bacterium]|nr:1,4-alpha-glucan branching protein domain-containing protein [Verrucomicrobiae bacterium]